MLEKLLAEIKNGGTTSPAVLASRLNTSQNMIRAMLETIEMQGYLKSVDMDCNSSNTCDSCSLSNMCSSNNKQRPRVRILTDKQ